MVSIRLSDNELELNLLSAKAQCNLVALKQVMSHFIKVNDYHSQIAFKEF